MGIIGELIDIIYPPKCHICNRFLWRNREEKSQKGIHFCNSCLDDFYEITSPLCPICSMPYNTGIEEDHICEDCLRKRPYYDALGVPYMYEGAILTAIHQFKYAGKNYLADSLGPLLLSFARRWLDKRDDYLIMPVPLHPKRLRERGFNQSLLLARHLTYMQGSELDFLSLRRLRYTIPQTGLNGRERRKNVRRAFELVNGKYVKGRRVVIVDDVATTGNTLNECARVLKKRGAKEVFCVALARTAGRH